MNHCDFNNCILHIYFFLVNQLHLPVGEIKLLLTYLLTYLEGKFCPISFAERICD